MGTGAGANELSYDLFLQRIFLRIARPAKDGLDTRRRADFTELPPEAAELVLKLANERLLLPINLRAVLNKRLRSHTKP
jgi:hypothetical protein